MDEEILRKEFEEWWNETYVAPGSAIGVDKDFAKRIWLESARRADRKARLECVEIVRGERIANECACEADDAYNVALTHAEHAIRATIKEE